MMKRSAILVASMVLACGTDFCQQQGSSAPAGQANAARSPAPKGEKLEFEVATIKPSKPGTQGGGVRPLPGGQTYEAQNVPVRLIIRLMFHLMPSEVSGGPDWINTDLWDIQAKSEEPRNIDDLHAMFQNLLIERFKLQFHYEEKTQSVFGLELDKSGSKMKMNPSPEPFDIPIQGAGFGQLKATHCSMSYLTWFLSAFPEIAKPVVDETGLPGFYDFTLAWAPELPPGVAERNNLPPAPGPELFTAVREQLGLRLDSKKGPVQVMVIDHIEKPSEADN